ncbi:hypothetical protein [Glutamicibacter sp. BW77]|uniref:hypothetical protein n=1 Tax=Glutamicibacter sp. BW77 TaxID=2024402 RepID=UPI0011415658|nr:hypothetical protein [Glutamicibacter sp. BW77]
MLLSEVDTRLAVVSKKRLPAQRLRLSLLFGLDRAVRHGRRIRIPGTALSWLAVNLLMAFMNFEAWKHFFTFTEDRGAGLASTGTFGISPIRHDGRGTCGTQDIPESLAGTSLLRPIITQLLPRFALDDAR